MECIFLIRLLGFNFISLSWFAKLNIRFWQWCEKRSSILLLNLSSFSAEEWGMSKVFCRLLDKKYFRGQRKKPAEPLRFRRLESSELSASANWLIDGFTYLARAFRVVVHQVVDVQNMYGPDVAGFGELPGVHTHAAEQQQEPSNNSSVTGVMNAPSTVSRCLRIVAK